MLLFNFKVFIKVTAAILGSTLSFQSSYNIDTTKKLQNEDVLKVEIVDNKLKTTPPSHQLILNKQLMDSLDMVNYKYQPMNELQSIKKL